ncbi:class I SAM-dependent methyltransferase [Gammaproteobacteria bacterium]|nr:class I SAM-dependent methyltransferase [Gammaproteobacteria bacterium]
MTQPIDQRLNYHPDPRESDKSDRKVLSRFSFIASKIDLKDKVVLDLGCSGGFFAFEISKIAKKVIAIDGDKEIIERNKSLQSELGIKNIEFICSNIDKNILDSIGNVDVTLFLSVFHHMLTMSDAYDWNNGLESDDIRDMLTTLNDNTSALVFEMGEVNEGYEWCVRMPNESKDHQQFVIKEVFRKSYKNIDTYKRLEEINFFNTHFVSKLSASFKIDSRIISIIKRIFQFDARDFRKIHIGKK